MAVGSGGDRMFWSTLTARATGVPMVVWSHLFPVPGEPEFEWINRRLYPWVHALVALGRRHADALADAAKAPRRRIHVIRNGVDVDAFHHPEHRDAARGQLGLEPHETAVGMVANLRPIKRVGLFLDAAARVRAARPHARFFLVGDGPQRDELQARIDGSPDLRATIHLLGPRQDVPALVQAFDIVCLTSLRECLSVAMLEAMAAGKPFVAPRVGSLDEALLDGQTGRFFEPQTADALADVLIELIDDPAQRARLGDAARAKVRSEFRLQRMAREFEDLVTELCTRTARTA
jgi:glycosyltransferase involved in cell wall biosynthesis